MTVLLSADRKRYRTDVRGDDVVTTVARAASLLTAKDVIKTGGGNRGGRGTEAIGRRNPSTSYRQQPRRLKNNVCVDKNEQNIKTRLKTNNENNRVQR